jgi:hypothetical protein
VWGGTVDDAYFVEAPSALLRLRAGDLEVNVIGSLYRRGIPYSARSTVDKTERSIAAPV